MEIHLDCLGGLAGDMFVACVLDAFPEHQGAMEDCIARLAPVFAPDAARCERVAYRDGIFAGSRFIVPSWPAQPSAATGQPHSHGPRQEHQHEHQLEQRQQHAHGDEHAQEQEQGHEHEHKHEHEHEHEHEHRYGASRAHDHAIPAPAGHASPLPSGHVAWADIRARLQGLLPPGVLHHALGIFGQLAAAEAAVHGVAVDAVEFHEVGAWDSVVDIVAAASLIDRLDARRWSVSALPLGAGRVRSAHGPMPVPPPATALLLRGFDMVDDGIGGERVTPTGAAILKHLLPDGHDTAAATARREPRRLRRTGVGFGSRRLDGISNCVRLLAFDSALSESAPAPSAHRELAVVEFEVDDQSAEDLAMGLDRLRGHEAVFDVVQAPVFGKKGRMMTAVRLLARPTDLEAVLDACFRETTTIGLRHATVRGRALPRRSDEVVVDGHRLRVKTVERPGGATAKAESDDALAHDTHQARRRLRQEAERQVLEAATKGGHDS